MKNKNYIVNQIANHLFSMDLQEELSQIFLLCDTDWTDEINDDEDLDVSDASDDKTVLD